MVFKVGKFRIDLEASKLVGTGEHQLVIQHIHREHTGEYKCQVQYTGECKCQVGHRGVLYKCQVGHRGVQVPGKSPGSTSAK